MRQLTVWILQTGEPLPIDEGSPRPMRAMNLSNSLVNAGHRVVIWSSLFDHQTKKHRTSKMQSITVNDKLEIKLISSCGYKRNISLKRIIDHIEMAINLKKMLRKCSKLPDVAFVGYPPIETAAVMIWWLSKNGIPTLLDVKDQWPIIFAEAMPTKLKLLGNIIIKPYFLLAKYVFKKATGISTMAKGFLKWALGFAGREQTEFDNVFPLVSKIGNITDEELNKARKWWNNYNLKVTKNFRICYVGNHSPNVDLAFLRR